MTALSAGALGFVAVLLLAGLRAPLALALGLVGAIGTGFAAGWDTALYVIANAPFDVLNSYGLSVIPLFILMGALAVPTGLASELVLGANALLGHYRGGLAMGSVVSCAVFGRLSGSDIADLTTMTKMTIPGMLARGYHPRLAAGSVASASTLAILMPPSVPLVIYAMMTETSVGTIFAGSLVPGIILTLMFMAVIVLWVSWRPEVAPKADALTWGERLRALRGIWGVAAIIFLMMGGMYAGFFSPTEAASVGAGGVLLLGVLRRRLGWTEFVAALRDSVRLSAVIFLILIAVRLFHYFIDSIHLSEALGVMIKSLDMAPIGVMLVILVALLLLGCVMDSLTILLITVPFLHPIVQSLGFDAVWFGVVMAMTVQLGLIHPPFGLNVFILSSMMPQIKASEGFWGCAPFVVVDILLIVLVLVFPQLINWLPQHLYQ